MSEVKHFIKVVKRAPRADIVILFVTFLLTIFVDLVVAVNIGVILAVLHFLLHMAESVEVQQQTEEQLALECSQLNLPTLPADVLVYAVEGPFFFGAAEVFENTLAITHTDPRVLIIRLRWVPFIDITGLQTLEEVILDMQKRGVRVILSGAKPRVETKLRKAGIFTLLGQHNVFKEFSQALEACQ